MARQGLGLIHFFFFVAFGSVAFANSGITYHGKILRPDGVTPINSVTTQFRMQIRTPGGEDCLLWEEQQTKDLSQTSGTFAITINDTSEPSRIPNALPFSLERVFSNRQNFTSLTNCAVGTTYNPTSSDGRKLQVYFREAPTDPWELLPAIRVNFVPAALNSLQLEGYSSAEFLKVEPTVTQTALNQTQVNTLLDIISGTSTLYVRPADVHAGDLTGTKGGPATVVGIRGVGVTAAAPTTGQVLKFNGTAWAPAADDVGAAIGDATYAAKGVVQVDTSLAVSGLNLASGVLSMPNVITAAGPIGSAQNIPVITYDAKGRLTTVTTATVDDNTKLPLAGGTLTGNLNMGNQQITNAASVSATSVSTRSVVLNDNDTNTATIQAPLNLPANYTLTLPVNAPTNGFVLSSDGTGQLSWIAPSAGSVTSITSTNSYLTVAGTAAIPTLTVNVGTAANTVAAGDDTRIVNAVQQAAYANDLALVNACAANQKPYWNTINDRWECTAITGFVADTAGFVQGGNSFAATATLGTNDNQSLSFETNNATRMIIANNGDITIGNVTPTRTLDINVNDPNVRIQGWNTSQFAVENITNSVDSPTIRLSKSGNNAGSMTLPAGADVLGSIKFNSSNTSSVLQEVATIEAQLEAVPTNTSMPTYLSFATTPSGSVLKQERLRITGAGNVGIGTTSPATLLDVAGTLKIANGAEACSIAGDGGMIRYNGGNLEFCNGSAWQTLGVSGAGLTSLNGQTGSTQTFAVSATGTAPAINSATNVHTLSIPLASGVGVTSGTISKTDYDTFNAKLGATLNDGQIWIGNGTNVATARSVTGDVTISNTGVTSIATETIVNADISTSAAIARTKLANGTANHVLINDSTGVMSSEAQLAVSRGGTGATSFTGNRIIASNGTGSALQDFSCGLNQAITFDGAGNAQCASVGGAGSFVNGGNSFGAAATLGTNDNFGLNFETNNTTRMTILNNGDVGIGTTLPSQKVTIQGGGLNVLLGSDPGVSTSAPHLYAPVTTGFSPNPVYSFWYQADTGISNPAQSSIAFLTSNNERLRLTATGNVGIGTNSPNTVLDINGAFSQRSMAAPALSPAGQGRIYFDSTSNKFRVSENGGAYTDLVGSGGAGSFINGGNSFGAAATLGTNDNFGLSFETNGTNRLNILNTGNIGIGTASPDMLLTLSNGVGKLGLDHVSLNFANMFGSYTNQIATNGNATMYVRAENALWFGSDGTDAVVLDNTNLGIGTSTPLHRLSVSRGGNSADQSLNSFSTNSAHGPLLLMRKSANNTVDTLTATSNGHLLGMMDFQGNTSTVWAPGASIQVFQSGAAGAANVPAFMSFATSTGSAAPAERMRIDSAGNVGIGTTGPNTAIDIAGAISQRSMAAPALSPAGQGRIYFDSTSNRFRVSENGGAYTDLVGGGGSGNVNNGGNTFGAAMTLGTNDNFDLNLETNGSTRVTVLANGNVGIGTTNPASFFTVYDSSGSPAVIRNESINNDSVLQLRAFGSNATPSAFQFELISKASQKEFYLWDTWNATAPIRVLGGTGNNDALVVSATGNIGAGTASPSTRIHSNVTSTTGNSVIEALRLTHEDSNSAGANGIGTRLIMTAESNSAGVMPEIAAVEAVLDDATNSSKDSTLRFYTLGPNAAAGANTATEKMRLDSAGNLGINVTSPNTALDVSGAISQRSMAAPALSPAGQGRIYFDSTSNKFRVSENGGAYTDLVGGGAGGFVNGGNSFGAAATLGTNDNFALNFETNGTTRMSVLANGNVGIGTTSPNVALQINRLNGGFSEIQFTTPTQGSTASDGTFVGSRDTDGKFWIWNNENAPIGFATWGIERMFISPVGNVGIGNTNPGGLLTIGTAGTTGATLRLEGSATGYTTIEPAANAGSWVLTLPTGAGANGQVLTTNGAGVTSWTTVSGSGNVNNGGNAFGAAMTLGTNDNFGLNFETNGVTRWTINAAGDLSAPTSLQLSGTNGGIWGQHLNNFVDYRNARVIVPATGAVIDRDVADGNPALQVQQVNASSTGDILQLRNNSTTVMSVSRAGRMALNTGVDSNSQMNVSTTMTQTSGQGQGIMSAMTVSPTAGSSAEFSGIYNYGTVNPSFNITGTVVGIKAINNIAGANTKSTVVGVAGTTEVTGSGAVGSAIGTDGFVAGYATATTTHATGLRSIVTTQQAGSTFTNAYGVSSSISRPAGTITNGYGIWVGDIQATNKFSIYTTDATAPVSLASSLDQRSMAAPALSPAGQGRIYFDSTSNKFRVSENGGAYTDLVGGGGGGGNVSNGGNSFGSAMTLGTNDNFGLNLETNGTNRVSILNTGEVGIGVVPAAGDARLRVNATQSGISSGSSDGTAYLNSTIANSGTSSNYNIYVDTFLAPASTMTSGFARGVHVFTATNNTNVSGSTYMSGIGADTLHQTNTTLGTAVSIEASSRAIAGTLSQAVALRGNVDLSGTGNITDAFGLQINSAGDSSTGQITNNYGIYVANQTAGVNNYSIYSDGGRSYFAGDVGVGTTTPNAKLTVQGAATSRTNIIASGASVDLSLSNNHLLKSVGGTAITLSNLADGGTYTLYISDTTSRTYTFSGCTNTYFSPANGATTFRSAYTISVLVDGANTECYISWQTGFN